MLPSKSEREKKSHRQSKNFSSVAIQMSEVDNNADGQGDGEKMDGTDSSSAIVLRISISKCRNLPENSSTVISYRYPFGSQKTDEDDQNEEDPSQGLSGSTEPFEEAVEGTEHVYNYLAEHRLPATDAHLLQNFISLPLELTLEGLAAPGKVNINLRNLVWRPKPSLDDPEDEEFLPEYPGACILGWFKVEKAQDSSEEDDSPFPEQAEVLVKLTLSQLLCSKEELDALNVITVSMHGVHQLPRTWHLPEGESDETHPYKYELSYFIPGLAQQISAANGKIFGADRAEEEGAADDGGDGETEPKPRKAKQETEQDVAYLQMTESKVSLAAEKTGPRITFDHSFTTTLQAPAIKSLKTMLERHTAFPVSFSRALRSDDAYVYRSMYHGLAEIDLTDLLKPGATRLVLRCPIGPHSDYSRPTAEALAENPPPDGELEDPAERANPYLLAETYLVFEINMLKPLNPEPTPPPPELPAVRELIPARPPVPVHALDPSAERLVSAEMRQIAGEIDAEYMRVFAAEASTTITDDTVAYRRKQLLHQMSASGKYYDLKERLRRSVTHMVRERFRQSGLDPASVEAQQYVAGLYVRLQELVSPAVRGDGAVSFTVPAAAAAAVDHAPKRVDETSPENVSKKVEQHLRLATEAETNLDVATACRHMADRIVLRPGDPGLWCDYGALCLRQGDVTKGEECLLQALHLDPRHPAALLALGVVMLLTDRYPEAESRLRGAVDASPGDMISWAILALYLDIEGRETDRRGALKRLTALEAAKPSTGGSGGSGGGSAGASVGGAGRRSAFVRAAAYSADLRATVLAERAAVQDVARHPRGEWTVDMRLVMARAYLNVGQYARCREHLAEALRMDARCGVAMTLTGHSYYMEQGLHEMRCDDPGAGAGPGRRVGKEAQQWYEKALTQKPPHLEAAQFMRLGRIYFAGEKWADARATFAKACRLPPPAATSWLGLAVASFRMQDLPAAESALGEAAALDGGNPEVWGMMCVVCGARGKADDAEHALGRALRLGLTTRETFPTDAFILQQAGAALAAAGLYASAAAAYRRGLETSAAAPLTLGLGRALAQDEGTLPAAAEAFRRLAEDDALSSGPRVEAIKELVSAYNRLNRPRDAKAWAARLNSVPHAAAPTHAVRSR